MDDMWRFFKLHLSNGKFILSTHRHETLWPHGMTFLPRVSNSNGGMFEIKLAVARKVHSFGWCGIIGRSFHCQVEHHVRDFIFYFYFFSKLHHKKWSKFYQFFSWVDIHNIYCILKFHNQNWWSMFLINNIVWSVSN